MKIYIIVADNGMDYEDHSHWNVAAALTKEAAEKHIDELNKRLVELQTKHEELDNKYGHLCYEDWPKKERQEADTLWDEICDLDIGGKYWIEELEIIDAK